MFIVRSSDSSQVKNVTALLVGRLGDLIVATPLLRALRARFPSARLRLVTSSLAAGAAEVIPFIDETLASERFVRPLANLRLAGKLLRGPCDVLIDLNPSFSRISAAMAATIRAPLKIAFEKGRLDRLYGRRAAKPAENEHMLDRYARLAALIPAPYEPRLELKIPEAAHRAASKILMSLAPDFYDGSLNVAIHPGNFKKFDNRWPEENFIALTNVLLVRPRLRLFYLAGPGELSPVKAIVARLKKPVPIVPPSSIAVAAAMISRMRLCVLNITGTTHLAAAVGTPTFGLYSGYTDAVWRPRGPQHAGSVSTSWESCRDIPLKAAHAALSSQIEGLESRKL